MNSIMMYIFSHFHFFYYLFFSFFLSFFFFFHFFNLTFILIKAIRRGLAEAKKAFETTTAPLEKAKAEVELDVYTALANATGVQN